MYARKTDCHRVIAVEEPFSVDLEDPESGEILPVPLKGVIDLVEEDENGNEKKKDKAPDFDYKLEALIPVLKREIPLRCHAHRADDIAVGIRIAEEFNLDMSWEHATEGHRLADYVASKEIPAVFGPALMGRGKWEMRELDFRTPKALYDAGVKLALQTDAIGRSIQFLPIAAAFAMKYGLPYDEALKAITINPAEILGVSDRVGSLEVGKDADIRVLNGEPLDIQSHVELVLIDGKVEYKRD